MTVLTGIEADDEVPLAPGSTTYLGVAVASTIPVRPLSSAKATTTRASCVGKPDPTAQWLNQSRPASVKNLSSPSART